MLVSRDGIVDKLFINCHFLTRDRSYFKRNSVEFLVKFLVLENSLSLAHQQVGLGSHFFKRTKILDALRVLGWVSRNWDLLMETRRLPCVDSLGRGVTFQVIPILGLPLYLHFHTMSYAFSSFLDIFQSCLILQIWKNLYCKCL